MPTLVNNLRAIRGPVTAVPVTAGSGIEIAADTQNNQIVISSNLEAGSGIEIVDDNGKAKIINSDNAQALPIVAGTGVKLSVVNNQVVVSADETVLWSGNGTGSSSVTLSESMANFSMLRILVGNVDGYDGLEYKYFVTNPDKLRHIMYMAGGTGNGYYVCNLMTCTNTTLTVSKNVNVIRNYDNDNVTGSRNVDNYARCIHEVVGINRLSN